MGWRRRWRRRGGVEIPSSDTYAAASACANMGQALMGPPSVEGWQGGGEWINTGTYVARVNFVGKILNDADRPGVRAIIDRIGRTAEGSTPSPEGLVDACIEVLGPLDLLDSTHSNLVDYATKFGEVSFSDEASSSKAVVALIGLIVSTQEYQMA